MARFEFAYFLALALAVFTCFVQAAPLGQIQERQVGGIACNVARLQTVAGLSKSAKSIQSAITAAGSDAASAAQLQTAATGITSAQAGVKTIAGALLTGQAAPADARTQVGDGLTAATTALNSINSTDATLTSAVTAAQSAVAGTVTAGEKVVSDCGS